MQKGVTPANKKTGMGLPASWVTFATVNPRIAQTPVSVYPFLFEFRLKEANIVTTYIDPFDAATQAGNRPDAYYGRMDISASFVKLTKGVGKEPWSDSDSVGQRRTEVHMVLNPIDASGLTFLVERRTIAESSEWSKIIWASLRDLGLENVRDLHGKYVRSEMVRTGRTYTSKRGDTQEEVTFHFTHLYNNEAEATAAYYAEVGGQPVQDDDPAGAIDMGPLPTAPAAHTNGNAERATAEQFLGVLVRQAEGDAVVLSNLIANMPLVNKYFTVTSPEVLKLMGVAA
jgi:hypothetical protein